ncbi:ATP-binding cassette domain-containing protein [Nonomuraea sp. NPDC049725]|uniref:ABC-F family ATP-binding cassette domain-containing protein n=1 Tax=Nonomuraea sp. NPDC049725 TaxID=3154508 RepID=UPI003441606F
MRTQLSLSQVTKRYDDRVVLDRVSFTVKPGEKTGVIGENGSGKSTLLKLLAGAERPDNGDLTVAAPGGVGYLPQALELPPGATVGDAVDHALADLRDLETRMRAAEQTLTEDTLDAYAALVERFEARGGYEADARVDAALHGLGLPGLPRDRPVATLSGGERSRLALAATLASAPELLLLDEPTNDLDDQAVAWLEQHLRAHRGTVVAITHDRVFLDRVTTSILEVDHGAVRRYGNGYGGYLAAKAAERAAQALAHEEWKAELARHAGLVTANAGRLAAIPRKVAKAGMGTGAWRARSRTHGAAGRIRQSHQRAAWLRAHPVPPPPPRLHFTTPPLLTTPHPPGPPTPPTAWPSPPETPPSDGALPLEGASQEWTPPLEQAPLPEGARSQEGATSSKVALSAEGAAPSGAKGPQETVPSEAAGPGEGLLPSEKARLSEGVRPAQRTASPEAAGGPGERSGRSEVVVEASDLVVRGRLRLAGLCVRQGERLLVTGPNGAGKSTLMQVLAGELTHDGGTVRRPARVGYLRQDQAPAAGDLTLLRAFAEGRTGDLEEHAETLLALGLFRPRDLLLRMGELSYGQRRRVELARLVTSPADLLLLDEPTNHLSPLLVEELEEALAGYGGALVVVTHDRRMRAAFTGSRLELRSP